MSAAIVVLALAYVLGSLPFSYWLARRRGVDVRSVGSGNVGATNVMRSVGRGAGLLALALDAAKGAAASSLGLWLDPHGPLPALAATAAVVGHVFPIWLAFRGGKGVATGLGGLLPLAPWACLVAVLVFAATLFLTRFVSLGSICGAIALAVAAAGLGSPLSVSLAAGALAAIIVVTHRGNIGRLVRGTERQLGASRAPRAGQPSR